LLETFGGRATSALTGQGFDELLVAIEQHLFRQQRVRAHAARHADGDRTEA
jgi:hypothetical protein